jgi:hypothetical protein
VRERAITFVTLRSLVVLVALGFVLAACALITSYDGFTGGASISTCGKHPPARPSSAQSTGAGLLFGATTEMRFLDEPNRPPLGFDLDNLCTCPDRAACRGTRPAGEPCDVQGTGIDNAGGSVLKALFQDQGFLRDMLATGRHGMIVRVQGYNGQLDDPDVTVAVYNVLGVNGDTQGKTRARFDGTDEFIVDDGSLIEATDYAPIFFDTSAYVSGGVLVASLSYDLRFVLPTTEGKTVVVNLPVREAKIIGAIEAHDAGVRLTDAQLVGRVPVTGIFELLSRIGVCQTSATFEQIRQTTCTALDLPGDPAFDGKDVACDALSLAIGFSVAPARMSGHATLPPTAAACGSEPPASCTSSGAPSTPCVVGRSYCGGNKISGDPNTLYRCSDDAGSGVLIKKCGGGCRIGAETDACDAPLLCTPGGYYCGGDKIDGDPNVLYRCGDAGTPTVVRTCPNGCSINPGNDDSCR